MHKDPKETSSLEYEACGWRLEHMRDAIASQKLFALQQPNFDQISKLMEAYDFLQTLMVKPFGVSIRYCGYGSLQGPFGSRTLS